MSLAAPLSVKPELIHCWKSTRLVYSEQECTNLALDRSFISIVEKITRQGRPEGCHRMCAATHLICGLESV